MNDMNLAKLTTEDLPLFLGITSDLFPGFEVPAVDYEELIRYITNEAIKLKLQVKYFISLLKLKFIFVLI
jgi:dynein heavy chain